MTSPSSAQKAAGEIIDTLRKDAWERGHNRMGFGGPDIASIIQQAITEAVDAAVAQERERYALAAALAMKEKCAVVLSTSPRKAIYESAAHIRTNVKPVTMKEVEMFMPQALESLVKEK